MPKSDIVIITSGRFPEGDAGAVRLGMVARAMVAAGHSVTVLCHGGLREKGNIDGIDYISLRKMTGNLLFKAIDRLMFPRRVKSAIKGFDTRCIYIYNAPISVFNFAKKYCKKNNIRLVHDSVEWYSPEEFKDGEKSREYRGKNRLNTEIIDESFSVIAISRYLEEYYSGRGIRTLRVPVLCDAAARTEPKTEAGEVLTLFYAGIAMKKDYIEGVIRAAVMLSPDERARLKIILIGATKDVLIEKCEIPESLLIEAADMLDIRGRIPRTEVLSLMEAADFVMIPRDASLRYAKAGFPSKVTEALANATPIFANLSSDLELYLVDGENAVLAESHRPEDLLIALRRAIALTPEEKLRLSAGALRTAQEMLDYHIYSEKISDFLFPEE